MLNVYRRPLGVTMHNANALYNDYAPSPNIALLSLYFKSNSSFISENFEMASEGELK
jgi:hypothetical protein